MLDNHPHSEPVNDNHYPEIMNYVSFRDVFPNSCEDTDPELPSLTKEEQEAAELSKLKAEQRADASRDRIPISANDERNQMPIRIGYVASEFHPEDSDEHINSSNKRKGGSGLNDSTQGELARIMAARKKTMNKRQHKNRGENGRLHLDTSKASWGNNQWINKKVLNSQLRDNAQAEVEADTPEAYVEAAETINKIFGTDIFPAADLSNFIIECINLIEDGYDPEVVIKATKEVCDKLNNGFKEANFKPSYILPFVLELEKINYESIKNLIVECAINYQNMQKAKKVADAYNALMNGKDKDGVVTPIFVFEIFSAGIRNRGNFDDNSVADLVFDLINRLGTLDYIADDKLLYKQFETRCMQRIREGKARKVNEILEAEEESDSEETTNQDEQGFSLYDEDEFTQLKQNGYHQNRSNAYDVRIPSQEKNRRKGQKGVRLNTTRDVGKLHLPKTTIAERALDTSRRQGLDMSVFNGVTNDDEYFGGPVNDSKTDKIIRERA
jgi:hypothetical protein